MEVKSRLLGGTFWTTLSTIVSALVQIATLSILSRFLAKTDFGVVAIVTTVYGLIQTFANLGFSVAVMHKKDLTANEFSSLFWIQLIVFALIYLGCVLFTPVISRFYEEPMLLSILPLFLVALLFLGIGQLYGTLLLKEMQFKTIAVRNITSQVVALTTAVVLAILDCGIYSYVFSLLIQIVVVNVWNLFSGLRQIKIKLFVSIKQVRPLVKIGLFQTGSSILDYLSSSIDVFIIGKWLGMENLGIYNLAKDLVKKIVALFTTIATKVATPFFSKIQERKDEMVSYYKKMINLLSLLNFPICVFLGGFSYLVVYLMYGADNLSVAPVLTVFALWGMIVSVASPVSNIIVATGRTDLSFIYTICRIIIVLPLTFFIALKGNLMAMAFCTFICELIVSIVSCKIELTMTIGLSIGDYISSFFKQFIFSIVFMGLAYFLLLYFSDDYYLNIWRSLLIIIPLFSVYIILFFLINKKNILGFKTLFQKSVSPIGTSSEI